MRVSVPPSLVEHARDFAEGRRTPVEPRDAATVILMRPGVADPEVYLLRRQTSMAFAGGMCVFPGGGVDPRDHDASVAWAGPSPAEWGARLGVSEAEARALVCAAVRETFEESGVLLAGESAESVVADTSGDAWEADREALEAKTLAFSDFLSRRGLVLRTDHVEVWSAWTTPEFEPRRYRTFFFAASLPVGQRTRDVSVESSSVLWRSAGGACDDVDAGEIGMLPPTWFTCLEISQHASPSEVLRFAAEREVEMFMPALEGSGESASLSMPARMAPLMSSRAARSRG